MTAPIAAVVMRKEREVVSAFESAGALDAATARPLDTLDLDADGLGMRRLRERAIVREAAPGRFYLDREVWLATRRMRKRLMLVILLAVLIAIAGVVMSSRAGAL
jgi:hypothetical protein